jgi:hypothetical protein
MLNFKNYIAWGSHLSGIGIKIEFGAADPLPTYQLPTNAVRENPANFAGSGLSIAECAGFLIPFQMPKFPKIF